MGARELRRHPRSAGNRAACENRHVEERGLGWREGGMERGNKSCAAPGHASLRAPCTLPRSKQVHSTLLRGAFERVT